MRGKHLQISKQRQQQSQSWTTMFHLRQQDPNQKEFHQSEQNARSGKRVISAHRFSQLWRNPKNPKMRNPTDGNIRLTMVERREAQSSFDSSWLMMGLQFILQRISAQYTHPKKLMKCLMIWEGERWVESKYESLQMSVGAKKKYPNLRIYQEQLAFSMGMWISLMLESPPSWGLLLTALMELTMQCLKLFQVRQSSLLRKQLWDFISILVPSAIMVNRLANPMLSSFEACFIATNISTYMCKRQSGMYTFLGAIRANFVKGIMLK